MPSVTEPSLPFTKFPSEKLFDRNMFGLFSSEMLREITNISCFLPVFILRLKKMCDSDSSF